MDERVHSFRRRKAENDLSHATLPTGVVTKIVKINLSHLEKKSESEDCRGLFAIGGLYASAMAPSNSG